ncbi:hypothetical protein B0H16DRAFT_1471114 [Mycena metata]|uniref:Uncharacterized protein n=1 Tax=Mycena metata TaxID=1033252 RepID=A0AAD7HTM2_9AGAR|nr:hypothetical protein B0H16DRAFT_1471114 [Mycena metata]
MATDDDGKKRTNMDMDIDGLGGTGDGKKPRDHQALQPGGVHGGAGVRDQERLEVRMMDGEWRIHGRSGAPVCASALKALSEKEDGEEDDVGDECAECTAYCKHVGRELLSADASLLAAVGLRDLKAASDARSNELALVQGELRGARRENNKTIARYDALQRELTEVSAKNAVLEKDKERLGRDRDKMDEDYLKLRKYADDCRRELDELERELARVDSNRHRKKITPQNSGSTTHYRQPGSGADEDVTMKDASIAGNRLPMSWGSLTGIPKYSVDYAVGDSDQLPPACAEDFAYVQDEGWKFADIPSWTAAYYYTAKKRCWAVAILVFREYYDARMAARSGQPLSIFQRHVLDNYALPDWMLSTWKEWALDTDEQNKNRAFWAMAPRPRNGTLRELAVYIQKHGQEVDGCPFVDNYHTIRSRDARGLQLWLSLNYVPTSKDSIQERHKGIRVNMALLRMLATPNAYEDAVLAHNLTIADKPEYESWPGHITEALGEIVVAEHLSGLGVTIAVANDAWAYAVNYLDALIARPREGWEPATLVKLREHVSTRMVDVGIPVGLVDGVDYLPRTPGLPWPDAEINRIQEDGLFLEDIPTTPSPGSSERGKITCARSGIPKRKYAGNDAVARGTGSPRRAISGRGRGGYRGRGSSGGGDRGDYRGEPRTEQSRSLHTSAHAPRTGSSQQAPREQHAPHTPSSSHPPSTPQFQCYQQPSNTVVSTAAGQPPSQAPLLQYQQPPPQFAASVVQPPVQWNPAGPAAPLTFGTPAQSNAALTSSAAPSFINFEGRTYQLGPAHVQSTIGAPSPSTMVGLQPHHFIPTNMVGPATGLHHPYPYATVAPASINASNSGLMGTPMTDLYQALPAPTSDMTAGFDMQAYSTSGPF